MLAYRTGHTKRNFKHEILQLRVLVLFLSAKTSARSRPSESYRTFLAKIGTYLVTYLTDT